MSCKYKPGDELIFDTTKSDFSILNGTKCIVVSCDNSIESDPAYEIEFVSPKITAFENELHEVNINA